MKKIFLSVITLVIAFLVIYNFEWLIGGYSYKKEEMKSQIEAYLINEKKYKKSDITEIRVDYLRKFDTYFARVIFSDEKDKTYGYSIIDGEVMQTGIAASKYKKDDLSDETKDKEPKHKEP
ncbi:DUF3139 domain-containing protein [Brevibacillus laterosporus]|uniref:DUF3139 domain-containing protein n=1 Tax=Brevibacillus laterosporus TaxID=1465 RepID=A0A0F7EI43_BRELA|nr:DUF3139 domain-containing protein [Brevibacillus laterosporus]AKF95059.1 hypothetical protein EX87_15415 [Brevibacillus laterosporus]